MAWGEGVRSKGPFLSGAAHVLASARGGAMGEDGTTSTSVQLCLVYRHLKPCDRISFIESFIHSSIHSFLLSFNTDLLNTFSVPGTGLGSQANNDQDSEVSFVAYVVSR